ncbi:3-hydroxyacyl-CoA dehydrogenase NAD-binding domain-containing protein [Celerinatantimonas sp. MCCC 1A17872]|uniref:3-hydroxyacyl-CoA dehydrogenase NAD-binding domain-containing protein n=1 Tax=Celerinatantimonas sp. MCCC 1A17872 TaxID=3177514 RepID=UPI0038BF6449
MENHQSVAVIGAGVIGLCWSALFAAKGYHVRIFDPRADLDNQLTEVLPSYIKQLPNLTEDIAAICHRVSAAPDIRKAVQSAQFVQESGPEKVDFKQDLWALIESFAPASTLFLSSSSGIVASVQGAKMHHGERIVIGHPFNPPHILPLVEVCADAKTPKALVQQAIGFYKRIGKTPVQLNHEKPAFVANRLQMALVLEAIKLVDEGVVGVHELDEIVTHSLGIRWASVGPLLAFHLGGGEGGLENLLTHIGEGLAAAIDQKDVLDEALIARIGEKARQAYPPQKLSALKQERDRRQQLIIDDQLAHHEP